MRSKERRAHLRYRCDLPIGLRADESHVYELRIHELSLGGMRIACDNIMLNQLLAQGIKTAPAHQVFFDIILNAGHEQALSLRAQALGVLRESQNRFIIRFQFHYMKPDLVQSLATMIEQYCESNPI